MNYLPSNLDDRKTAILKTWGICDVSDIADMDDIQSTVTFRDGTVKVKTEVFSRVMGYFRPVSFFNHGKRQEHRDRRYFKESTLQL